MFFRCSRLLPPRFLFIQLLYRNPPVFRRKRNCLLEFCVESAELERFEHSGREWLQSRVCVLGRPIHGAVSVNSVDDPDVDPIDQAAFRHGRARRKRRAVVSLGVRAEILGKVFGVSQQGPVFGEETAVASSRRGFEALNCVLTLVPAVFTREVVTHVPLLLLDYSLLLSLPLLLYLVIFPLVQPPLVLR